MSARVAAVVVNFNTGDDLQRCLESLTEDLEGLEWEAAVVDNASTDGSESAVARFEPRARLYRNAENLGFARAANRGIAATAAPLVLVLNPDCRLRRGAAATLEAEIDAYPECAIVGPRILDPDGSVQGSARGDPTLFTGLFGRSTLLTRWIPAFPLARRNVRTDTPPRPGERSVAVDWVSGACMLARREALERAGGFDETFFLYWEDADLCRRLRGLGYTVRYVPGAIAVHRVGQSSRSVRALAIREFHRSAYRYYTKHVATQPWHPARWLAWSVLGLRSWWQRRRAI